MLVSGGHSPMVAAEEGHEHSPNMWFVLLLPKPGVFQLLVVIHQWVTKSIIRVGKCVCKVKEWHVIKYYQNACDKDHFLQLYFSSLYAYIFVLCTYKYMHIYTHTHTTSPTRGVRVRVYMVAMSSVFVFKLQLLKLINISKLFLWEKVSRMISITSLSETGPYWGFQL